MPASSELRLDRDPDAVATAAAMEDLLPAQPEPRHDVLEVGHRRRCAAEHGGIERAAPRGEQPERRETGADLEAPVGDVLVRHTVAGDVQRRAEQQRERARADDGSQRRPRGHVQRDDHRLDDRLCSSVMGLGDWMRRLFSPSAEEGDTPDAADAASGTVVTGGLPGLAGLEVAEATEAEAEATEPPPDPAP